MQKSARKNYQLMLPNSILKNIVMAMSKTISRMLVRQIKQRCARCSIMALLVYAIDQIYCSASFMPPVFLLDNFS